MKETQRLKSLTQAQLTAMGNDGQKVLAMLHSLYIEIDSSKSIDIRDKIDITRSIWDIQNRVISNALLRAVDKPPVTTNVPKTAPAKVGHYCKNCHADISHKDARSVFCSNKGVGNCKDAYHNKQKELAQESDDVSELEYGHPMASGMGGHGQS